ncbi:hypothetical protein L218DRAFT_966402 [Marasmius fiardii PR-910]|nr:hypothetical protein L218DRAFT_966402 [Marasmius fiardii PR-910]
MTGEGDSLKVDPSEMLKWARGSPWNAGMVSFVHELEKWRDEGNLRGIEVSAAA